MLFQAKQKPLDVTLNQLADVWTILHVQVKKIKKKNLQVSSSDSSFPLFPIGNTASKS